MLDFHIGGLIVSCGCFRWLRGSNLGVVRVIQGPVGWKQKFISYDENCFGGIL